MAAAKYRNTKTASNKYKAQCPGCGFYHFINGVNWNLFGLDCWCMKCVDRSHVTFMKKNAAKMKMTCVKNCPCGFGVKS